MGHVEDSLISSPFEKESEEEEEEKSVSSWYVERDEEKKRKGDRCWRRLEIATPSVAQRSEQFSHLDATLLQVQKQDASENIIYYWYCNRRTGHGTIFWTLYEGMFPPYIHSYSLFCLRGPSSHKYSAPSPPHVEAYCSCMKCSV